MSRRILPLNRDWRYAPEWREEWASLDLPDPELVELPHANLLLPPDNFDESSYQFLSCYQRRLALPALAPGERAFLDFEGAASKAAVYVDGRLAAEHSGGYTPFSVDLGPFVREGELLVTVRLDSREDPSFPPFGNVIDYLTYGGIYREVALRIVGPAFLANLRALPEPRLAVPDPMSRAEPLLRAPARLEAELFVAFPQAGPFVGKARLELRALGVRNPAEVGEPAPGAGGPAAAAAGAAPRAGAADPDAARKAPLVAAEFPLYLESGAARRASAEGDAPSTSVRLSLGELPGVELWDAERPFLHELEAVLLDASGAELDRLTCRLGFREARVLPEGFLHNGRRLVLRGLDRHQAWPVSGYAMPERAQRRDALLLRRELACNVVRTSHYPQSRHFLDACDELGLLVMEEIPGWQHIGDEAWKTRALEDLRAMLVRDWNRPAVFLWGVRINESQDDHEFYARTNALARSLDPSRQTGGVRYLAGSEFLEDVYTFNDFLMGKGERALRSQPEATGLSRRVPYLVTENNGHMFPTKTCDGEERLVEHALRHARVHNAAGSANDTGGALAWVCADYNTHYQFGSGDRVCHHGVLDQWRQPKFAARLYASQRPLAEGAVLEPLTYWTRGERSEGGVMPLWVMTNCEEVGLEVGGVDKGRFRPDRLAWAGLAHPPIRVDTEEGAWGMAWEDARFVGYAGGRPVAERRFAKDPLPVALEAHPDDPRLRSGGPTWDATRLAIRLVDRCGNHLPYAFEPLEVEVEGPLAAIGETRLSLRGGRAALWLRTTGGRGRALVRVRSPRFSAEAAIDVD